MVRDITERKQAEQEIMKLNEDLQHRAVELESLNKELEAFSYSVSHDLRAPLRSISGFSQALLEDYLEKIDVDGQDYLHRVRAASIRMGELIDALLGLSRITRSEINRETTDLSEIVKELIKEQQESEPERQVEIIITSKLVADCDPRLLRAVLQNLISNAWKFTGKKPIAKIEFGALEHDGKTAYFVRDNGAGFDKAYGDKLFGAFQRLHSTDDFKGIGIGLATVKRIIHRHGGSVWAEGEVEKGATFYFTL
jgi:light-regulated signal transduction histidine kinase (bacteriophytochrome)